MRRPSLTVHPLFWVCGIYFCVTGTPFPFLLVTLAAVEHEFAHAVAAERRGYRLDRIVLMPYGAVVKGNIDGITLRDELAVALAGPLASGGTAALFAALWWFFPETYPYTDAAFYACLSLCLVNLLPALPLDGGRVLYSLTARLCGKSRAWVGCCALSALVAVAIFAYFVYSCFHAIDLTALLFALFLAMGLVESRNRRYERIRYDLSCDLTRGVEEKRVRVNGDFPLFRVGAMLSAEKYLVLDVATADGKRREVPQEALLAWLETGEPTAKIGDFLTEKEKK